MNYKLVTDLPEIFLTRSAPAEFRPYGAFRLRRKVYSGRSNGQVFFPARYKIEALSVDTDSVLQQRWKKGGKSVTNL